MDNPFGIKQETADVRPIRFYQKFLDDGNGGFKAQDWVDYACRGQAKFTVTPARIKDVERATDGIWECLKGPYESWKQGNEAPLIGTPLAAWSGVSPELAAVLKTRDILTVEDIVKMTDTQIEKSGVPGMRIIRDQARAWEASKDSRKTEAALTSLADENAALKAQMEEMRAMLASMPAPSGRDHDDEPIKRRPGRPRKDEEEAA